MNYSTLSARYATIARWLSVVPLVLFVLSFNLPVAEVGTRGNTVNGWGALGESLWTALIYAGIMSAVSTDLLFPLYFLIGSIPVSTNLWFLLSFVLMILGRLGAAAILSSTATVTSLVTTGLLFARLGGSELPKLLLGYWVWLGSCVAMLVMVLLALAATKPVGNSSA